MDTVQDIALQQGYISVSLTDFRNTYTIVSQVLAAGQVCREHQIYRLAIYLPHPPGPQFATFQVYRIVTEIEPHWSRRTIVAIILAYKPTQLEKFGIDVARNRGILIKLFTEEVDALHWLRQRGS